LQELKAEREQLRHQVDDLRRQSETLARIPDDLAAAQAELAQVRAEISAAKDEHEAIVAQAAAEHLALEERADQSRREIHDAAIRLKDIEFEAHERQDQIASGKS